MRKLGRGAWWNDGRDWGQCVRTQKIYSSKFFEIQDHYNGDCVWGEIMQLDWPDCNLTMMVMMLNVNDDDVDKDKEEEKEGRLAKLLS